MRVLLFRARELRGKDILKAIPNRGEGFNSAGAFVRRFCVVARSRALQRLGSHQQSEPSSHLSGGADRAGARFVLALLKTASGESHAAHVMMVWSGPGHEAGLEAVKA